MREVATKAGKLGGLTQLEEAMKNREFKEAIRRAEVGVGVFSAGVMFITILHIMSLFV